MSNRTNYKILWVSVIIVVIIILITNGGIRHYRKKRRELKKLKEQVSNLKSEFNFKKDLLSTIKKDPSQLELLAREKLGLIKPGEVEYRFITEPAPDEKIDNRQEDLEKQGSPLD